MSPINLMLSHKLRLNPFKGGGKSFCCSIILKDITVLPNGNVAMHVNKLKAEEQRTHRCLCGMEANFLSYRGHNTITTSLPRWLVKCHENLNIRQNCTRL